MGRTRTNKIVVFRLRRGNGGHAGRDELIGELVDVRIEQANGFSLYGTPLVPISCVASKRKLSPATGWIRRGEHDLRSVIANRRHHRGLVPHFGQRARFGKAGPRHRLRNAFPVPASWELFC